MTYVSLLGLVALAVYLRVRHPSVGEGHKGDATRVNLNLLLGATVVLLLLRIIIDVAGPGRG